MRQPTATLLTAGLALALFAAAAPTGDAAAAAEARALEARAAETSAADAGAADTGAADTGTALPGTVQTGAADTRASGPAETIERTLALPDPAEPRIEVDNLDGPVTVRGANVDRAHLVARRTVFADTPQARERAAAEVRLEMAEHGGLLAIWVDAPGRTIEDGHVRFRGWERLGYRVRYDLELHVPRAARVRAATVTGALRVEQVEGGVVARNVNGDTVLVGAAGRGEASTVNGSVRATFRRAPDGPWSFSTVNGAVDVTFPPGLAADLAFKTLNGSLASDFPVTAEPRRAATVERRGRRTVVRGDPWGRGRIGGGGPELTFQTVNGSIFLRRGG